MKSCFVRDELMDLEQTYNGLHAWMWCIWMIIRDRRSLLSTARVVHPSVQSCGLLLRLDQQLSPHDVIKTYRFVRCRSFCGRSSMSKKQFGHTRSRSECFQIQPVTCWHLLVCLYLFEVYSLKSSKMIRNFLEALTFYWLSLELNQFNCN